MGSREADEGRAAVRLLAAIPAAARALRLCLPTGPGRTAAWLVPAVATAAPAARLEVLVGPDDGTAAGLLDPDRPGELRVVGTPVPLLLVVDGTEVVPGPAEPVRALVDALWAAARPVRRRRPEGLAAAALGQLVSGSPDRVAAQRLAVSERTYRRAVAGLMADLGASSRFEAGARAAAWGWLPG